MIKHTVTKPWVRRGDISSVVHSLNWPGDANLGAFGIRIDGSMLHSQPSSLDFPSIFYGNRTVTLTPTTKYNIMGNKFFKPTLFKPKSLRHMTWVNVCHACSNEEMHFAAKNFKAFYQGHGGSLAQGYEDEHIAIRRDWTTLSIQAFDEELKKAPQKQYDIIFFVIPSYHVGVYDTIKRNMDHRLKVVSQVLLAQHVKKANNGSYWGNVCQKVHAKAGGTTCVSTRQLVPNLLDVFKDNTMIIGLDVSHGAPGTDQPSIAAMSVSLDEHCAFYGASCQTNGYRQEIVEYSCMRYLLYDLLHHWSEKRGGKRLPQNLLFFRDGVSEGQFQQVLDTELKAIKQIFKDLNSNSDVKVTVIIATKRHHIRAFMEKKTSNKTEFANPSPGTLIEDVATHPKHWDFFLYSHNALQGTSRPVHYHVIKDEIKFDRKQLPKLIYEQCFQYCRCASPVSLHPAVYYAHLAAKRATVHINPDANPAPDGPAPPLLSIGTLRNTMWFA